MELELAVSLDSHIIIDELKVLIPGDGVINVIKNGIYVEIHLKNCEISVSIKTICRPPVEL